MRVAERHVRSASPRVAHAKAFSLSENMALRFTFSNVYPEEHDPSVLFGVWRVVGEGQIPYGKPVEFITVLSHALAESFFRLQDTVWHGLSSPADAWMTRAFEDLLIVRRKEVLAHLQSVPPTDPKVRALGRMVARLAREARRGPSARLAEGFQPLLQWSSKQSFAVRGLLHWEPLEIAYIQSTQMKDVSAIWPAVQRSLDALARLYPET